MKSMTGFGQGQAHGEGLSVQVELSSVNRKNLDLHLSLPRGMNALEARCHKLIAATCARGRVQMKLLVENTLQPESRISLDEDQARCWLAELNAFAEKQGLEPVTRVTEVLRFPRVMREELPEENGADCWPLAEEALRAALQELSTMRKKEGRHLQEVLGSLCADLQKLVEEIRPLLPAAREEVAARIRAAVGDLDHSSPEMRNRLLQEIALQAERSDVQEEVDRLQGHLVQMREKLQTAEPVGRALDFICQEMARELNTLAVKAARAELNRLALAGKETVEKIREQVQNVE